MTPRILVFAGSIRTGAFSGKTADAAMKELALQGAEVTRISLADYPLPIMDEDLEDAEGIPENAMKLGRLVAAHDGMLIASPEYNASVPPLLKNTLDWISRIRKDGGKTFRPYSGKVAGLCSSSDGHFAGARALYHLRAVLMNCQVEIVTPQCSVAHAADAFNQDGRLKDNRSHALMEKVCRTVIERASMLSARVER
jgi:chromate reductase, NAD(P)H dehydrogenase (quinone)